MLESVISILVGFFLIAEPIFIFNAYGKKGIKHQAKVEHKTEDLMQKAEEHLQKFEQKETGMNKAEEVEKSNVVQAQSFAEKLKFFINSEKNFEDGVLKFISGLKNGQSVDFPRKEELIRTLREETFLADEILKETEKTKEIAERIKTADKKEMKKIRHDLHAALVEEKEGKFEHSLSKEEIDLFKKEYHQLAKEESEIKKEGNHEQNILKIVGDTSRLLKKLKTTNSSAIKILNGSFSTPSRIKTVDEQEEVLVKKKKGLIEGIVVNLHIISKHLEHLEA